MPQPHRWALRQPGSHRLQRDYLTPNRSSCTAATFILPTPQKCCQGTEARAAIALLPRGVMEESRRRAREEPLRLARNWPMAVLIAALWVACLEWLTYWLVNRYGTPVMRQYLPYGMIGLGLVCAGGFAIWLVRRVRKERRKQKVAAAVAAKKALEAAATVAMAPEATDEAVVTVKDETKAGSGDLAEDIDVERGLQRNVATGFSYQHAVRTTAGAAGLRQPLLAESGRGEEAEGAAADKG
ncbi:hypothetical protein Vafri_12651 [Volvox africanus]|uniref:Uncharacterized protein n=1 Tax=Volvox africanus TaxID=51714 RepID=A0A8J4BAJ9_9CHLO|nr:hypothetical protein Vafri_12651 [Volvox africanus]